MVPSAFCQPLAGFKTTARVSGTVISTYNDVIPSAFCQPLAGFKTTARVSGRQRIITLHTLKNVKN
ncbi:MAG: hypothetical protein LBD53_01775 [Tannerella sp.]|nr:hypothetical protein [Tannerella sp.]